jgi:hypothetical protein
MTMCFLNLSTGACTLMYWRLPGNGTLEPQHVAVFKTYAQSAILLGTLVCDVVIMPEVQTKHPHITIK